MDRDYYRLTARHHNIVINTTSGDDLTDFPIEKARFTYIWYTIVVSGVCTTAYGWAIQYRAVLPSLQVLTQPPNTNGDSTCQSR